MLWAFVVGTTSLLAACVLVGIRLARAADTLAYAATPVRTGLRYGLETFFAYSSSALVFLVLGGLKGLDTRTVQVVFVCFEGLALMMAITLGVALALTAALRRKARYS
jgi:hypothetical protein